MNEFVIKNGLIVNGGTSTITGSLTVTGTISSNSTISVGGHGYFTQGIWANTYRNLYGAEVFRITYTTNNVLIGTTVDSGARLHVAAPGALLSDIAFKIRNSADTADLVTATGLGQVSIGIPSLSSIYKLGVSGSTVIKGSIIIQDDSGNFAAYSSDGSTQTGGFSFNTYVGANIYTSNSNPLKFSVSSSEAMRIVNGGNIGIGTTSPSARLDIRGTQTAAGAIARTMLISSSLSASANNDVLVGLDIAPTFTAGAFTGVQQEQLVIRGNGNPIIRFKNQAGTTTWGQFGANVSELSFNAQAGSINFVAGNNQAMYVFASTRNTLLQNGGTFTDDGINRLQVSGSARITAGLTVTGSLTTKAPGALSTDIALRARNSVDTLDIIRANGLGNVFIGLGAGNVNTGVNNSFFGINSGYNNSTGDYNSYFGVSAGVNNTTGGSNSFFGTYAGLNNTLGSSNLFIGTSAGRFIADGVTSNTISNNSTFLGYNTKALANNQTNQIVIGHEAIGVGSNSVVLGNDTITKTILKGNVGIGTTSPAQKLDVTGGHITTYNSSTKEGKITFNNGAGAVRYDQLTQKLHLVTTTSDQLTIDGLGNVGIGTTIPGQKLEVNGNALIKTSFLGTITAFGDDYASFSHTSRASSDDYSVLSDNVGTTYLNASAGQSIKFRIDNIDKAILDSNGNFGIGTITPNTKLDVNGDTIITGSLIVTGGIIGALQGTASYAVSASWAPSSGGGGGDTTAVEAQTWFLI